MMIHERTYVHLQSTALMLPVFRLLLFMAQEANDDDDDQIRAASNMSAGRELSLDSNRARACDRATHSAKFKTVPGISSKRVFYAHKEEQANSVCGVCMLRARDVVASVCLSMYFYVMCA